MTEHQIRAGTIALASLDPGGLILSEPSLYQFSGHLPILASSLSYSLAHPFPSPLSWVVSSSGLPSIFLTHATP